MPLQGKKKKRGLLAKLFHLCSLEIRKIPSKSNLEIFAGEYLLHSCAVPRFLPLS